MANKTDAVSLLVAAHEARHKMQHEHWVFLFGLRWITLVNLWLEWEASAYALSVLKPILTAEELQGCRVTARDWLMRYALGPMYGAFRSNK